MKTIQYDDTKHIDESTVTTEDNPNLNNWNFKRQLNENFTIKKDTCPKEDVILHSKKGRKIKVFGRVIRIKGLFRLPSIVNVEVNSGVKTTKLNKYMFPRTLFMKKEAKMARIYLCKSCPVKSCYYKEK